MRVFIEKGDGLPVVRGAYQEEEFGVYVCDVPHPVYRGLIPQERLYRLYSAHPQRPHEDRATTRDGERARSRLQQLCAPA